MHSDARLPSHT